MSEIKGQLLGLILVLVIFGGISVAMAGVFSNVSKQVQDKSKNLGTDAAQVFVDTPSQNTEPAPLMHY